MDHTLGYCWHEPEAETRRIRTVLLERRGTVLLEPCGTFLPDWTPEGWRLPPADLTGVQLTDRLHRTGQTTPMVHR